MPPIKNWKKIDDKTYRYEPDKSIVLKLRNSKDMVWDERRSLWFADLFKDGEWLDHPPGNEQIVDGARTLKEARKEAVRWMRNNPELDFRVVGAAA